jgi:hypothetical protein
MIRNRVEVSTMVVAGKAGPRRGVSSVEQDGTGVYTIHFAPEKPVRAEAHRLSIAILNADGPRTAVFSDTGGASIGVRIFDGAGQPADADFQFSAERI